MQSIIKYICPKTKIPLNKDKEGNLWCLNGKNYIYYKNYDLCIDFVGSSCNNEIAYYNEIYKKKIKSPDFQNLQHYWNGKIWPQNKIVFDNLPYLKDKIILLVGNGISEKEFFFLNFGAYLIYSDISLVAMLFMKNAFDTSILFEKYRNRIVFHAIDALNLPFPDESIDLIYGYALVHHFKNPARFFSEIHRVLKKGGEGIFMDDAYSPIWQFLKNTIFKPLQKYSHKKHGISPEDLWATRRGGFKRKILEKYLEKFKLEICTFTRVAFFSYLYSRGIEKLFGNKKILKSGIPIFNYIDALLAKNSRIFMENQIRLIWGLKKV